jgi:hypothetical protein
VVDQVLEEALEPPKSRPVRAGRPRVVASERAAARAG